MPELFYKPISRKTFLKTSLKAAGLTVMTVHTPGLFGVKAAPDEIRWALLSDTHIAADEQDVYRNFYPYKNLKQVVPQILNARPEAVVINGDVARLTGQRQDYENVQQLLTPVAGQVPVYMTMGNHDDRAPFYQVFQQKDKQKQTVEDKHVMVIEAGPVRMILLDSLLYVNKVAGLLGKAQRTWLQSFLEQSDDTPSLLFVHHTLEDRDSDLLDVERLFAIIKPYQKVKAIFYGHSHQYKYDELEGIHLVNQPAVGYNFADDQPVGWLDARFTRSGAELTLHAIGGNTSDHGKTTSLQWR